MRIRKMNNFYKNKSNSFIKLQDKITINSIIFCTESEPLKEFEAEIKEYLANTNFENNELSREYVAHWEITDKLLYLTDIEVISDVGFKSAFPKDKKRVFANWFSGEIIVEREKSKLLSSLFRGYHFQKKFHYTFKNGVQTAFYPIDYMERKIYQKPF